MAQGTDWPIGEAIRAPARPLPAGGVPARGRRGLPRVAWVLSAAAFACGALLSAAGFSVGWRHQAQRDSSTRAALAAATARNHALTASLERTRAQLAATSSARASAEATTKAVSREASALATEVAAAGRSADSVSLGASALGGGLGRLASELRTLSSYLASTPAGQLDPGYVVAQAAYLSKQLDTLQAEQGDLGSAVSTFEASAKKLADRASVLAGRN
jgi:chromosome segregation ATPase